MELVTGRFKEFTSQELETIWYGLMLRAATVIPCEKPDTEALRDEARKAMNEQRDYEAYLRVKAKLEGVEN